MLNCWSDWKQNKNAVTKIEFSVFSIILDSNGGSTMKFFVNLLIYSSFVPHHPPFFRHLIQEMYAEHKVNVY